MTSPRFRILARNALALLIGIGAAVSSVSLYELVGTIVDRGSRVPGETYLFTAAEWVRVSAIYSGLVATGLTLICIPIWLVLSKHGMARWHSAVVLGFLGPFGYWVLVGLDTRSVVELLGNGVAYGLCGAFAGLAVWWTRPQPEASGTKLIQGL